MSEQNKVLLHALLMAASDPRASREALEELAALGDDPDRLAELTGSAPQERTIGKRRRSFVTKSHKAKASGADDEDGGAPGADLARWYARWFDALEESGLEPTPDDIAEAEAELDGSGWSVGRDDSGDWRARPTSTTVKKSWRRLGKAAQRAPAGFTRTNPFHFNGRDYVGGQFIPGKAVESASPADREKLTQAKESEDRSAEAKKQARGSQAVDLEGLKRSVAPAHGLELTAAERGNAARAYAALKRHHGGLTLHRVAELAGKARQALDAAGDDHPNAEGLRDYWSRQLAAIASWVGRAEGEGMTGEAVAKAEPAPALPAAAQVAPSRPAGRPIRFEAGRQLSKAEKDEVLRSVTDAYKEAGLEKTEVKGYNHDDDPIYGYPYSPDLFATSDITGAKVRHYLTLPDGRKAHPSELFPQIKQADINRAIGEVEAEGRNRQGRNQSREARHAASKGDANNAYKATNRPMAHSFLAEGPDGRIVRIDGTDAEDAAYFDERGYRRVSDPVAADVYGHTDPRGNARAAVDLTGYPNLAAKHAAAPAPPDPHFTGTLTDSAGRTYQFVDGVRVAAGGEGAAAPRTHAVFQGRGRADQSGIYAAGQGPVLDGADYYAFDERAAGRYGPDVSRAEVSLSSPAEITSDRDWLALAKEAGVPSDLAMSTTYGGDKSQVLRAKAKLREYLVARGHDGLVVRLDPKQETRRASRIFGHDQLVKFRDPASLSENSLDSVDAPGNNAPVDAQPREEPTMPEVRGTLKTTDRGQAVQVTAGELDRLLGRSVNQFEKADDAAGKEITVGGRALVVTGVGSSFKVGKVAHRYLYVRPAGESPEAAAPVPTLAPGDDPETWSQDRRDDEDYVAPSVGRYTADEIRGMPAREDGVRAVAGADRAALQAALRSPEAAYLPSEGKRHDEVLAGMPAGARSVQVMGRPYPASWVLAGGDLYLVRDHSGGDPTSVQRAPATPEAVAAFDRYAPPAGPAPEPTPPPPPPAPAVNLDDYDHIEGALKDTPRGRVLEAGEGGLGRQFGRAEIPGLKGHTFAHGGKLWKITAVGNKFERGRGSYRYLYVEPVGDHGPAPAPEPTPPAPAAVAAESGLAPLVPPPGGGYRGYLESVDATRPATLARLREQASLQAEQWPEKAADMARMAELLPTISDPTFWEEAGKRSAAMVLNILKRRPEWAAAP